MRTVWIADLEWDLKELLEYEFEFQSGIEVPHLPVGPYGEAVRAAFELRTLRVDWQHVSFLFITGDEPAREALPMDLVLEISDAEPAMTKDTVRVARTAVDAAIAWNKRLDNIHTDEEGAVWEAEREGVLAPLRGALDALAVLSDTLPESRVVPRPELRPFGDVLRCRGCKTIVTKPVLRVDPSLLVIPQPGGAMLQPHQYGVVETTTSNAEYYGLVAGALITSTAALVQTINLPENNVRDCCGFRADNGPNQICATCKAPIAAYWCAHSSGDFVVLSPNVVEIAPASSLSSAECAELYAREGYGQ